MAEKKEKNIYALLSVSLPTEAVQRTAAEKTRKGYDTTGFGYAYAVNRFNEVCGLDGWGYDYKIVREIEGQFKSGTPNWEICVELGIWVKSKENIRRCVGGHLATSYSDALKGAITNAFKKTAAFWGVGKQAYEGSIDDDNVQRKEGEIDRVSIDTEKITGKKAEPGLYVAIEKALKEYDEITALRVHKILANKDLTREEATKLLKDLKSGTFGRDVEKESDDIPDFQFPNKK